MSGIESGSVWVALMLRSLPSPQCITRLMNPGSARRRLWRSFFVPGFDETLRVNGTGRVVTDGALLVPLGAQGKVPATGLLVSITEAFFHCGKALIRSKLRDPPRRVQRDTLPYSAFSPARKMG